MDIKVMERNRTISCALRLDELILLKWPHYSEQYKIVIQTLSNTHDIFPRTTIYNPKIHMGPQKTPNCQNNLEKKRTILRKKNKGGRKRKREQTPTLLMSPPTPHTTKLQ